ncbi:MAG: prepilin-type N-terminal cleavage/methylation domain-containing protein [Patescibacteria group bacterium]
MHHYKVDLTFPLLIMLKTQEKRGFTLIELIISIAILAILVAVLVVAINPAEQLARSRDAKRVADLDALKSALNLYLATATTTVNLDGQGTANTLCSGGGGADTIFFNSTAGATTSGAYDVGHTWVAKSASSGQAIGASGWLPARFDWTPGGSPISNLPLDPTTPGGDSTYFYSYACESTNKQFKLTARLESTYFASDLNLDGNDGGATSSLYEVGSNLTTL